MLTPLALTLVLSSAFMHAAWNALLRGGADRAQSMLVMNWLTGCSGVLLMALVGLPSLASVPYVLASGAIHLIYNALLVRMYRSGDLGETYPVARGTSPALVALGGSLFAGEWLGAAASAGIGCVCIGIFLLAAMKRAGAVPPAAHLPARLPAHLPARLPAHLPWALTTGVAIACYSLVDGMGARVSGNWLAFTGASFACFLAAPAIARLGGRGLAGMAPVEAAKSVAGGIISLFGYAAIIWAMQSSPMGAVSALRETSVVFAALLGAMFLGEKLSAVRLIACLVIAFGAALIGLAR